MGVSPAPRRHGTLSAMPVGRKSCVGGFLCAKFALAFGALGAVVGDSGTCALSSEGWRLGLNERPGGRSLQAPEEPHAPPAEKGHGYGCRRRGASVATPPGQTGFVWRLKVRPVRESQARCPSRSRRATPRRWRGGSGRRRRSSGSCPERPSHADRPSPPSARPVRVSFCPRAQERREGAGSGEVGTNYAENRKNIRLVHDGA